VRSIAVRLLRCAAEAEDGAASPTVERSAFGSPIQRRPSAPAEPAPEGAPADGSQTATDLVGDMMLGQILLQRGQILEEHIHQAIKVQRATSARIGDIFVKIGACSRQQVADALSHQAACRRENLSDSTERPGRPTRAAPAQVVGEATLGEIPVERSVMRAASPRRALEFKQSGSRIGEALVKMGATTISRRSRPAHPGPRAPLHGGAGRGGKD
jgi:hypothetical protein